MSDRRVTPDPGHRSHPASIPDLARALQLRRTRDYIRHGTTSLFAALEVATGKVVGQTHGRHRNEEFRRFLNMIDREVPEDLDVHLILDNSGTHTTSPGASLG